MSERRAKYKLTTPTRRLTTPPPARPNKEPYSTRLDADVVAFLRSRPSQAIFLEARIRATPEFIAWQQTQPEAKP